MGIVRLLGTGSPSGTANNAALEHFGQHLPWEAGYFVSTYAIAYGLGALLHWMVRHWKLDRKFEALRFSNKWHYILSAEAAEFPKYADQYPDAIVYIYLTALVTIDKQPYLYAGFVDDWWFDDAGELDTVVLNDVVRYPISDGSENTDPEVDTVSATEPKQVPIPGHFFYLRFANTLNLSVQYISYEFEDVAGDSAMLEASSDSLASTGSATPP